MEKVFWLMWLADVAGSVGVLGVISAIAFLAGMVVAGINAAVDEDSTILLRGLSYLKWLLIPVAVACVAPSPKTIHVMAVASAADAATHTQLGAKSLEALNAVLDRVIESAKK